MNDLEKAAANNLWSLIKKYEKSIAAVLPKHLTPDRMIRLIVGEVNRSPKLAQCTQASVINAVLTAASLGIEIRKNSAYLLPFNNKAGMQATLVIDYRSIIDLAIRSGNVEDIEARLVYEQDDFELTYTDKERRFSHKPRLFRAIDGKLQRINGDDVMGKEHVILGYALAWMKGAAKAHIEPMTYAQIEAIRAKSKAKDDGPWVTDWEQMARKTLVKRIGNYIPQSPEMARAAEVDDRMSSGDPLAPITDPETGMGIIDITPQDAGKPIIEQSEKAAEAVADRKIAELKSQQQEQPVTQTTPVDNFGQVPEWAKSKAEKESLRPEVAETSSEARTSTDRREGQQPQQSQQDATRGRKDPDAEDLKLLSFMDRVEGRCGRRPSESQARQMMMLDATDVDDYWKKCLEIMDQPKQERAKPVFGRRNG